MFWKFVDKDGRRVFAELRPVQALAVVIRPERSKSKARLVLAHLKSAVQFITESQTTKTPRGGVFSCLAPRPGLEPGTN